MSHAGARTAALGVADAVGHCLLVFAFLPTLLPVPSWIAFEATNRLNADHPVVLAFVLVRGVNLLLDTFRAHVAVGAPAGVIAGALVSAWVRFGGPVSRVGQRIALGALAGVVGTALALSLPLVAASVVPDGGRQPNAAVTLELAAGLVCGLIATPTAIRGLQASAGSAKPRADVASPI